MQTNNFSRTLLVSMIAGGLALAAPSFASPTGAATPQCGGDKKKDKKDDEAFAPMSIGGECGGDKKKDKKEEDKS
jgi:hypothetical protein